VAIEADQGAFQFYAGGIIPAKKCGTSLDHGVLAVRPLKPSFWHPPILHLPRALFFRDPDDFCPLQVGYGVDPVKKMKYWIVKNSWSAKWGESGYVRIQKQPTKTKHSGCGIAEDASYAVV
jgi:hypothetical protein